jgi:hypothetical protein
MLIRHQVLAILDSLKNYPDAVNVAKSIRTGNRVLVRFVLNAAVLWKQLIIVECFSATIMLTIVWYAETL